MEWDEDEIVVEVVNDVVEVEIAETGTDVSIDEEKIELEIAAPEENTLEITDDLIELELIDEPEIVLEVGEGKAVWGGITGDLPDQEDLVAALNGKSNVGHVHDDRYYTEQEIDAALAVISAALAGKSDVGHVHDNRYYTQVEIDGALAVINTALAGKSDVGHIHDGRYYTETEIDAALAVINTALAGKSDTGHIHDDRYYTETEMDTKLNGKVAKSGDVMTGSLAVIGNYFQQNNSPDATKADNGIPSTVGYSFNRTDKNGLAVAYFDGYVRADGSIACAFGAINYNTSGSRVATLGLMINVQKNGTGAWTVSEPANFRNAIGAAAASNPVIITNPYNVVDSTVLSLSANDNLLIVCGNLVYLSVRFDMKKTTTGSTRALAFKSEYSKYAPVNYNTWNGVVFTASECWTSATQGMVYINGTWQIGISGGFQSGKGYIGTVTYLINS